MIEAVWDQGFKRSYRKRIHKHAQLKRQFREKMALFLKEPFDSQLRKHKLSGKLKGNGTWGVQPGYQKAKNGIATTLQIN
jgi:mRNA-degrading endonuclease YafQ of YafQ-DinJ toxin-antitoxin module